MKRLVIIEALEQVEGRYVDAAKALRIHPNSLLHLMSNLNVRAAIDSRQSSSRDAKRVATVARSLWPAKSPGILLDPAKS